MKHVYQDTPDYYDSSTQSDYWGIVHADAEVTAAEGYDGGYGAGAAWTGTSEDAFRLVFVRHGAGQSQFGGGIKFKYGAPPSVPTVLFGITDAAGDMQVSVVMNTDGTLSAYRGDAGGVEIQAGVGVPIVDTYYDLGLLVDIGGANGMVEIDLNESGSPDPDGDVYFRVNDVNTQAQATADWLGIYIGSTDETATCHLYARNGEGGAPDLHQGWTVVTLFPVEDGGYTGWTSNVATLWEAVDENPHDGDTTKLTSNSFGGQASVSLIMETVSPAPVGVLAMDSVATVRNETGSTKTYDPLVVCDADIVIQRQNFQNGWRSISDAEWIGIHTPYGLSPKTGLPWKKTDATVSGRLEWGGRTAA